MWGVSAAGAAGKGVRPMQQQLRDHEHYVQGVCWDPRGELVASVSCDRSASHTYTRPWRGRRSTHAPSYTCTAGIHTQGHSHTRRLAERHKTVAGTEMNARSSRSHTVFQLAISAARAALVPGGKVARPYVCVCLS